jgi:hypothetical protein
MMDALLTSPVAPTLLRRRHMVALALGVGLPGWVMAQAAVSVVQVWKDPNCGCCKDWIAHLEKNGFRSQIFETGNTAMRARLGMPQQLGSCHTAWVDGYVIEGHVPARDIQRLLKERPKALGLTVPRMPVGSPGMDGPEYGGRKDPYEVLLVARDGTPTVFQSYP